MNKKTEKISLNLPREVLDRVDALAKSAQMDRTRFITSILDECSKTLETTKKVGVLQFATIIRNFGEKMNEWAKKVSEKKVEPL